MLIASMQQNSFYQENSMICLDPGTDYLDPVAIKKPFKRHPSRRSNRLYRKLGLTASVLLFLYASFAVFYLNAGFAHAQTAPPKKNVLVLHGVWRIRSYEMPFNSTLHNEFLAEKSLRVGTAHVYLGLEDFSDNVYPQKHIEDLRNRVEKNPVDLVISFLPDANRFLLSYGQELFPGVPMVFAIPSTRDVPKINKLKNGFIIPSIAEKALKDTVEKVFSVLPDTRHLVVVCGDAPFDRNYLEIAKRAIASSKQDTKVSYLMGLPLDELWRRVSSLGRDTAILFTTYNEENGKKHETSDVSEGLTINANAPVFTFNGSLLGKGIVGGNITSPELYAKKTAEVALLLLKGEQPTAISTIEYAPFDAYDWRALKRWNISEDRLPPGSQVQFKTMTAWEEYKVYIIFVTGLICLESLLIYVLVINLRRRKKSEENLRKTEQRFRITFEQAAVGIAHVSTDGHFLRINQKFCDIVGYSLDEMINLTFLDITHPDDLDADLEYLRQLMDGDLETYSMDKRYICKDGEIVWINLTVSLLLDDTEKPHYFVSVIKDITKRKLAEADLRLKDNAIASSINAIGIADLEGTLTYVNDSLVKMWGYQRGEEILGRNAVEFFEGDAPLDILETIRKKGSKRGEGVGKRKDGSQFYVEFSANLIIDEAAKPLYLFGSFLDISEQKVLQEGLRLSKEFNQSVLMSLPEHIAVLDMEGKILTVNHAWEMFARQKDAGSLCSAEPGVNYLKICRDASDKGDSIATDVHDGIRAVLDGSTAYFDMEISCDSPTMKLWFMLSVSPFKGLKGGVIVSHTNITSSKMAEIELRNANTEIKELQKQLAAESAYLQDEIKVEHNFDNIIGQSEGLKYVLHRVEQVAPLETTVLILGETGTGKELMARAVHKLSSRNKRPLVKVNCAALPGELIESELFGRNKGAFTGATTTELGRFELAKGSTLFLDEIGELPLELQAKLLRVLESGEYERLGSSHLMHSDARIIAATNRNLTEEVRKGRFREDLWYRLKVFPITVPPLRDRIEDIPLLVNWFVEMLAKKMGKPVLANNISKRTMQSLHAYSWPGNIRELMHVVEGALISSKEKKLHFDLPKITDVMTSDFKSLEEMEHQYILEVLKAKNWKIGGKDSAASILEINVNTLRGRMKKLGINKPALK